MNSRRYYTKLVKKIQKAGYDVSISNCLIDEDIKDYCPKYGEENALLVYTYFNDELINKIKNIAENMNFKTELVTTRNASGVFNELFITAF